MLSTHPTNLLDFDKRIKAVVKFKELPEATNLASAYKRVANILSKNEKHDGEIMTNLLKEDAEIKLVDHLNHLLPVIDELYNHGDYERALTTLAELKEDVDGFFEHVMVNVEDPQVKANRIAILQKLNAVFSKTADISVLY